MNPNLIYDVGMHVGADTEFYLKKGFNVIAVEANPALVSQCAQRFSTEIASGQLKIVNRAVAEKDGEIDFFVSDDNDLWGTADPNWRERNEKFGLGSRPIKVVAVTMSTILREFGVPYYMKIDIEGHDSLCLQCLEEQPDKPKYVSIESHATNIGDTLAQLEMLKRLGYVRFKMVLQNDVHKQICPDPAREGRTIIHVFKDSASGLFGEESPGDWLDFAQIVSTYERFYWKVSMIGPHTGRFRHVKHGLLKRTLNRLFHPGGGWCDTHAAR